MPAVAEQYRLAYLLEFVQQKLVYLDEIDT